MKRGRNRRPAAVIATVTGIAGCPSSPPVPAPHRNVVAPAPRDAAVARDALDHEHYARAVLYTWTTPDQIDELRASKRLLVRDESPVSGASYLDQVLYLLAQHGDATAQLLYTTAFAKMRFAWHAPWATRVGWPNERYGGELIRVTLARDSVIVSVSSEHGIVGAHDLLDEPVPLAQVRAHPERIAAIYFVSDATIDAIAGVPRPTATFREFALCNEAMIESWEVGTDRIAQEVAAAATMLEALGKVADGAPVAVPTMWQRPLRDPRPVDAYAAALAFANAFYRFDKGALTNLVGALRGTRKPVALRSDAPPPFVPGTLRKPPRIVPNATDTYGQLRQSPTAAKP
jgi:hypothetical protein